MLAHKQYINKLQNLLTILLCVCVHARVCVRVWVHAALRSDSDTYLCGPSTPARRNDSSLGEIMSNWMGASGINVASVTADGTAGDGAAAPTGTDRCASFILSGLILLDWPLVFELPTSYKKKPQMHIIVMIMFSNRHTMLTYGNLYKCILLWFSKTKTYVVICSWNV